MKNNLIRIIIFLLAFSVYTSGLHNVNWVYRSAYIASTVVFLLVMWVGKQKFGIDKILYVKAYIFCGWLAVSVAISLIVGWDNYQPIANGSLFGIIFGMLFYSKEFWSFDYNKGVSNLSNRCYYCNQPNANNVVQVNTGTSADKTALPFCSEYCKEQLIKYEDYTLKHGSKITYLHRGLLYIFILLILIRMIIQYDNVFLMYAMFITLVGTGVTALIFPFAKLSECGFYGVKRTKDHMRIGSILVFIWAAFIIIRVNS